MQGSHTHIAGTNHDPRGYTVAAILSLLFMVPLCPVPALILLFFYVSTFRSMCAVPNMAVFCSSLTSLFPGMLLTLIIIIIIIIILLLLLLLIIIIILFMQWVFMRYSFWIAVWIWYALFRATVTESSIWYKEICNWSSQSYTKGHLSQSASHLSKCLPDCCKCLKV